MGRKRKTTALRNKKLAAQPESVLGNSANARRRRIRNVLPANGRPLGAKNVVLRDVRQIVEQIVDGYADRIPGILERIEKRNPRDAALVWARLLDYVVAKRAHVVVTPSAPVAPPIDTSNTHTLREAYERVSEVIQYLRCLPRAQTRATSQARVLRAHLRRMPWSKARSYRLRRLTSL